MKGILILAFCISFLILASGCVTEPKQEIPKSYSLIDVCNEHNGFMFSSNQEVTISGELTKETEEGIINKGYYKDSYGKYQVTSQIYTCVLPNADVNTSNDCYGLEDCINKDVNAI